MASLAKFVLVLIALGVGALLTLRLRAVKDSRTGQTESVLGYSIGGAVVSMFLLIGAFALTPAFGYIPVGHRGLVVGPSGVVMIDTNSDGRTDTGKVLGEGFYFVTPFLYNVEVLSVRTEAFTAEAEAASSDLQDVKATVTINYRIEPNNVWRIYQQLGTDWQAKVFTPAVQEAVKASTAQFNAEDLIQQRPKVASAIRSVLEHRGQLFGFEIQAVSIVNFNFGAEFNKAVEAKARATQEAQTAERNVQRVRAEQQQKILEYQADATRRQLELEAQAAGQKAQLQSITPMLIQLRYADAALEMSKRWDGKTPLWMTGTGGLSTLLQVAPPTERPPGAPAGVGR